MGLRGGGPVTPSAFDCMGEISGSRWQNFSQLTDGDGLFQYSEDSVMFGQLTDGGSELVCDADHGSLLAGPRLLPKGACNLKSVEDREFKIAEHQIKALCGAQ